MCKYNSTSPLLDINCTDLNSTLALCNIRYITKCKCTICFLSIYKRVRKSELNFHFFQAQYLYAVNFRKEIQTHIIDAIKKVFTFQKGLPHLQLSHVRYTWLGLREIQSERESEHCIYIYINYLEKAQLSFLSFLFSSFYQNYCAK